MQGETILKMLDKLKLEYGNYRTSLIAKRYDGVDGEVKKQAILSKLHTNTIQEIAGQKVVEIIDFLNQTKIDIPKADVVKYELESGDEFIIRPSGTEPLIKCYITTKNDTNNTRMQNIINTINDLIS